MPEPLFQDDPKFDDSIQVTFPNGKKVPLSSINKPHARIPGFTVPKNEEDSDRFYKEQAETKKQHQQEFEKALEKEKLNGGKLNAKDADNEKKTNEKSEEELNAKYDENYQVKLPNGHEISLGRLTKPHAPIFHHDPKDNDNAGGLLKTGDHRPSN